MIAAHPRMYNTLPATFPPKNPRRPGYLLSQYTVLASCMQSKTKEKTRGNSRGSAPAPRTARYARRALEGKQIGRGITAVRQRASRLAGLTGLHESWPKQTAARQA